MKGFSMGVTTVYITEVVMLECELWVAAELRYTPAAAAAKSLQSCPTLCDPIDRSPLGSPVPGIFQARVLEWGVIAFSHVGSRRPK